MLNRYPDYYKDFSCIADKCEATCCAGWQIEIDETSLERYRQEGLTRQVNFEEASFYQDKHKNCAFLREDLLCDMVLTMGEDMLCDTCRLYPRHIEEFEGIREYSLSISCPEVCRMILSREEPVSWIETATETADSTDDYDETEQIIYECLAEIRQRIFIVLAQRDVSLEKRCGFILDMVSTFQEEMDCPIEDEPFDLDAFLETMDTRIKNKDYKDINITLEDKKTLFETQEQWEYLTNMWPVRLQEAKEVLFPEHTEDLASSTTQQADNPATRPYAALTDIQLEQIITYFIYTYFCGSAYDEYYYGQAQLAVVAAYQIKALVLAQCIIEKRQLSLEEICPIVYQYSRELEHSSSNVLLMEELMEEIRIPINLTS